MVNVRIFGTRKTSLSEPKDVSEGKKDLRPPKIKKEKKTKLQKPKNFPAGCACVDS